MRPALFLLPELGDIASVARFERRVAAAAGDSRGFGTGCAAAGCKGDSQHLQRAADHERMGRCGVQRSEGCRAENWLRLERKWNPASAGLSATLDRFIQG